LVPNTKTPGRPSDGAPGPRGQSGTARAYGKVITGVDHEVGLQRVEGGHPRNLGFLPGDHVEVGDVQDGERLRTGGQDGQFVALEPELGELADAVRESRGAEGETSGRSEADAPQHAPAEVRVCRHCSEGTACRATLVGMSDLKNQIRADLKEAMKAKEKERTGTIRMLLAAIQTEETEGTKHELTDEEVLKVVAREIKKRRESAEVYAENGRQELADAELAEVAVLEGYQPEQLDDAELAELIDAAISETGATSMKEMGQVMKLATEKAAGRADGKRLSAAVKERLG